MTKRYVLKAVVDGEKFSRRYVTRKGAFDYAEILLIKHASGLVLMDTETSFSERLKRGVVVY